MIREEDVFRIGRLGRAHGVKGELLMQFDDDVFDRVDADYVMVRVDGLLVPFFFEEYRFRSDSTCIVKFQDVDTQEQARELTNCEVFFPLALVPHDDEDELRWKSLVGFNLIDAKDNRCVGRIADVDDQTVNVLFKLDDGTLIPAAEDLIRVVDHDRRSITIDIPAGLLEL